MRRSKRSPGSESEQGSMLPMFAGLIFVAFIVIALAVELSLLGRAYRSAASAADAAAEAGASMLAPSSVYESTVALDGSRVTTESMSVATGLASNSAVIDVVTTTGDVCVTVMDRYRPTTLVFVGVDTIDIAVTSCAEPRTG